MTLEDGLNHLISSSKQACLLSTIQKITVYETLTNFYIVGSNESETVNRVLRINRISDVATLSINEDQNVYDQNQIKDLLTKIITDNIAESRLAPTTNQSYPKKYSASGLLGFIRFTEGYYMILITKQSPVAVIGYNIIYTIEDTSMIYIPNNSYDKYQLANQIKEPNLDEQKYLKIFSSIDLKQNFYFSYTYDLTNTLQHNQLLFKSEKPQSSPSKTLQEPDDEADEKGEPSVIGLKNKPSMKYSWNQFLMKPAVNKISHNWVLNIIHGYLAQSSINIFGFSIYITIISRRSQKYAGTRFLKRGGTNQGYVANEVETEQIVHRADVSSFQKGLYTSFVHVRGSIPLYWSQDPKAVPKPPINIDISDPFSIVASKHMKQLLDRFGAPIIILNLVKMREKRAQESILAVEYKSSIDYIKQFLPNEDYIEYLSLDMAKLNKTEKGNVMNKIYEIAENCLGKTKFYQNFDSIYENEFSPLFSKNYNYNPEFNNLTLNDQKPCNEKEKCGFIRQNGVMRVNCVDCLDRTNTAMFVVGKCALAHQLYALGVITYPNLGQDSLCERMLIELYEKSGDAIAQQYAGSQLVHRVDTYGKNTLASQSRDMIHTISRYYSNTFADADRQNAMNLFLGIYQPHKHDVSLWELPTDIYLHDAYIMNPWKLSKKYVEWMGSPIFRCLPLAYDQEKRTLEKFSVFEKIKSLEDLRINFYENFYKPSQLTAFHEIFYFNSLNSNRVLNNATGIGGNLKAIIMDPFNLRSKRKQEGSHFGATNDKLGNISTTSIGSSDSESDDTINSFEIIKKSIHDGNTTNDEMTSSITSKFGPTNKLKSNNDPFANDIKLDINESKLNDYRRFISLSNDSRMIRDMYMVDPNASKTALGLRPITQAKFKNPVYQQPLPKLNNSSSFGSLNDKALIVNPRAAPIDQVKRETYMEKYARDKAVCASNKEKTVGNIKSNYHDFTKALPDAKMKTLRDFLSKPVQLEFGPSADARQFYEKFISTSNSA